MGTNATALIVGTTIDVSDEELLAGMGFKDIERVTDWEEAQIGIVRTDGCTILFMYDWLDSVINNSIEDEQGGILSMYHQIFPGVGLMALTIQSSTGLACFASLEPAGGLRRWAAAADHGVIVDSGPQGEAERLAVADGQSGEDIVHSVTAEAFGFDLLHVFEQRDAGATPEALFAVELAA